MSFFHKISKGVASCLAGWKRSTGSLGAPREGSDSRRNPFRVLWEGFCANLPTKEDSVATKARKSGFLFSLLVMVVAILYLIVDLLVIPAINMRLKNDLMELYHPDDTSVVDDSEDQYPPRMLSAFRQLYDRNSDVRGWLSFHAEGNKDFLNVEYPIVYADENNGTNRYLKMDFDGNRSRNGTLYFDRDNRVDHYKAKNRSLIVYGHNMASGQMLAGLNKLMNSTANARSCPTLTMSTLFRRDEYLVFAVILTDESDLDPEHYFSPRRTQFASDEDFLNYVEKIRARSIYDYPVEVDKGDHILVLSTCTGKTSAHVKDGRMVLIARRARIGEKVEVDTEAIQKNEDVIMPFHWYLNQKKTPHPFYKYEPPKPTKTTKKTKHTKKTTTEATETEETTESITSVEESETTKTKDTTESETTTTESTKSTKKTEKTKKTTTKTGASTETTTTQPSSSTMTDAQPSEQTTTSAETETTTETTKETTSTETTTTKPVESTTKQPEETTTTEKTTESTEETTTTTKAVETTEPSAEPTTEE